MDHLQSKLPPIILASTSPQRRQLLNQAGFHFRVAEIPFEEDHSQGETPRELVEIICRHKLATTIDFLSHADLDQSIILCSDTMVALDNERLGKPANRDQAAAYLQTLSGATHQVITGIVLRWPGQGEAAQIIYADSVTDVHFRDLTEEELAWYLDSGEWAEAAGAYRMQGRAACFIESLSGSYTGVMGLPLDLLYGILSKELAPTVN